MRFGNFLRRGGAIFLGITVNLLMPFVPLGVVVQHWLWPNQNQIGGMSYPTALKAIAVGNLLSVGVAWIPSLVYCVWDQRRKFVQSGQLSVEIDIENEFFVFIACFSLSCFLLPAGVSLGAGLYGAHLSIVDSIFFCFFNGFWGAIGYVGGVFALCGGVCLPIAIVGNLIYGLGKGLYYLGERIYPYAKDCVLVTVDCCQQLGVRNDGPELEEVMPHSSEPEQRVEIASNPRPHQFTPLLQSHSQADQKNQRYGLEIEDQAFGILRNNKIDGIAYESKLRQEW